MMNKATVIDADTILYLATYSKEKQLEINDVFKNCDAIFNDIIKATEANYYTGYLTDGSFRYKIAKSKPYKGNRVGIPKPKYFNLATAYLKDKYQFETLKDYEADDLCIMGQNALNHTKEYDVTIASPDKDLRQVPGKFYDYKKKETEDINSESAYKNLWKQVLTGDSGDNIQGIPGIGDKKAEHLLLDRDHENYYTIVLNAYTAYYGEYQGILKFTENYQLVKMLDLYNGQLFYPTLIAVQEEIDEWLK